MEGLNELTNVTFLLPTERSLARLAQDGIKVSRRRAMLHVITPETPIGKMRDNTLLKTGVDGQRIQINSYAPANVGPFGLGLLTGGGAQHLHWYELDCYAFGGKRGRIKVVRITH